MRQSQKPNRPRNKNGRKPNNGPSPNRVYESTGPEGKVRGTPQQIVDKYQSLARDKATSGDRVLSEAFQQHAEHYLRILTASQPVRSEERSSDERGAEDRSVDDRSSSDDERGEARGGVEARGEPGANDAPAGAAEGMAVIGDEDPSGSGIVETPENASPSRRRGRRPTRRAPRDSDEGGAERRAEGSAPAEAEQAADPGLPLEPRDPEVAGDDTVRAAE